MIQPKAKQKKVQKIWTDFKKGEWIIQNSNVGKIISQTSKIFEIENIGTGDIMSVPFSKIIGLDDVKTLVYKCFFEALKTNDLNIPMVEYKLEGIIPKQFEGGFQTEKVRFFYDFYFQNYNLLIEKDGGIWSKKRLGHSSGKGIERDENKLNLVSVLGFNLLRIQHQHFITQSQLKNNLGQVIDLIKFFA